MPLRLQPIETARLLIRPLALEDLDDVHRLLDVQLRGAFGSEEGKTREERRQWLQWTILGYDEFARLFQPPYGEHAVAPAYQRQGYATEAVQAMIGWAFAKLRLRRIVATTGRSNAASIGVMRRLGMRILENPRPDPPWLQVVGILEQGSAGR
jgi:RimJ/RimL family protein N-acetyltransferase